MRDGEDALNESTMRRLPEGNEVEKGVDGSEAHVACGDTIVPLRFQMLKKQAYERSIDIRDE
jgi:hypothetical protein